MMNFRLLLVAAAATLVGTTAHAEGWNASVLGGPVWSPRLSVGGTLQKVDSGFGAGGALNASDIPSIKSCLPGHLRFYSLME